MTRPEPDTETAEPAQARLIAHLAAAGYAPVTPPVLQPIEPFLELSGEDIRRRIFVTQDAGGAELCLRPEFTIPICRLHRQRADGQAADYSYGGPVFRLTAGEPAEFVQAGIESFGRTDTPAADAEVLSLALEGLALLGRTSPSVRLGDMGLTVALLDGLAVPAAAKRRTLRALAAGRSLDAVTNGPRAPPARTATRACSPPSRARTRRACAPSWRTCSPSPASRRWAGAARARSPSASSARPPRRPMAAPASTPRTGRSSTATAR